MTTLEGQKIVKYLSSKRFNTIISKLENVALNSPYPGLTNNNFAKKIIKLTETQGHEPEGWDFSPCVFLENSSCTIYQVRPFGCRCFLSKKKCFERGYAEIDPITVTLNTIFQQIIEHIDIDGYWGNMANIICFLANRYRAIQTSELIIHKKLQTCEPLPGFIVSMEEKEYVKKIISDLFKIEMNNSFFLYVLKDVSKIDIDKTLNLSNWNLRV